MRRTITLCDLLVGTWLLTMSTIVVVQAGRTQAWPLIPSGLLLLAIVCVRLSTKNGIHFGSAAWYLVALLGCLGGILEESSHTGFFSLQRFAEQLTFCFIAAALLGLHLRLWRNDK